MNADKIGLVNVQLPILSIGIYHTLLILIKI